MSIYDRYPQPSLNVDDMIALLWKKLCHIEELHKQPDINNTDITNNFNTTQTLTPHRHARLIFTNDDNNDYVQLQSSCEDANYIYCFYNHVDSNNVNNCMCRKINKETFVIIKEEVIVDGGHANGCCYNPILNKVFFLESHTDKVYMLDTTSLSVEATYHTGMTDYTKAITYDKDRDVFYIGRVTGLQAYDMNEVYAYKLDNNTLTLDGHFTVDNWKNLGTATQDWCYYNNALYAMTSKPNAILAISVDEATKGKRIACFELHSNECTIGELEGIDCYNGNFRITSDRQSSTYGVQHITQFFDTKNYYGTVSGVTSGDVYSCLQKMPMQIHVDINSTTPFPDGTTARPYKEIWEAVDVVGCNYANNCRILVEPGSYETVALNNGVFADIEGQGDNNCTIRGIFVSSGANLYLKRMRITRNAQMIANTDYCNLLENGGNLTCQNCWWETGGEGNYNIYVNTGSKLILINNHYTDENVGRGVLVGDTGIVIRDNLGYSDGMLVTKNNTSALILPPVQKVHTYDSAISVTTNLSTTIRQSQRYWQFIRLVLVYQSSYLYLDMPTTTTTTNAVLTASEGYCKFHLDATEDTPILTCTHNALTDLELRGYMFIS